MNTDFDVDVEIDEVIKQQLTEPSKYKVIFFNDDNTPVEWVVEMLTNIFKHQLEAAEKLTLQIHEEGSSTVGIYTYEVAEQKAVEATTASREQGYPLQIKVEEE
jgi:ATP-dependent Clp protease adaptor protein ClpS|tara:strand:- start:3 stop:314 length:312 start_codon:yes stop_codon:yes gene_type:complete